MGPVVRIGDRVVPARIDVRFDSVDGQPCLSLVLEVVDGVPQCRSLAITSVEDGREVRPLDLDAVRLREWVDDIYAAFALDVVDTEHGVRLGPLEDGEEQLQTLGAFAAARRGKAARRVTPQLLETAAQVYREHIHDRPIAAVAAAFDVSERSASDYITKARRAGYLPPTTRGKKKA